MSSSKDLYKIRIVNLVLFFFTTTMLAQTITVSGNLNFRNGLSPDSKLDILVKFYLNNDYRSSTHEFKINNNSSLSFNEQITASSTDEISLELIIEEPLGWSIRQNPMVYDKNIPFFQIEIERKQDIAAILSQKALNEPYDDAIAIFDDLISREIYETETQRLNLIRKKAEFQLENSKEEEAWSTYLYGLQEINFDNVSKNGKNKTFVREAVDAFLLVGDYRTAKDFTNMIVSGDNPNVTTENWKIIKDVFGKVYAENNNFQIIYDQNTSLPKEFRVITGATGSISY